MTTNKRIAQLLAARMAASQETTRADSTLNAVHQCMPDDAEKLATAFTAYVQKLGALAQANYALCACADAHPEEVTQTQADAWADYRDDTDAAIDSIRRKMAPLAARVEAEAEAARRASSACWAVMQLYDQPRAPTRALLTYLANQARLGLPASEPRPPSRALLAWRANQANTVVSISTSRRPAD